MLALYSPGLHTPLSYILTSPSPSLSLLLDQINPNDLSNDGDPKFLAEFYKNLKILSQDLYKKSAVSQLNSSSSSSSSTTSKFASLKKQNTNRSLNSNGLASLALGAGDSTIELPITGSGGQAHPADYFSPDSIQDRMKLYATHGGLPVEYYERYLSRKEEMEQDSKTYS